MDSIKCLKHKDSKLIAIYLSEKQAKLICEHCQADLEDPWQEFKLRFNIVINKALSQPEHILRALQKDNLINQYCLKFQRCASSTIEHFSIELESQIKNIQQFIAQLFENLKESIKEVQKPRLDFQTELRKMIKFDDFAQILEPQKMMM